VGLILGVVSGLFGRWINGVLGIVRTELAAAYVGCVAKVHRAFIALLCLALCLLLALAGFVLIHVALFAWLPWSLPVKALLLLILGVIYLGCGLAVTFVISSDRTWMKFAKVDRILAGLGR
jgi:hypothetical protein